MLTRRTVLGALCATLPMRAAAGLFETRFRGIGQRFLWVRLAGRDEEIHVAFRRPDGRLIEGGIAALSWAFRDWKDGNGQVWMDHRLFDLLAHLQTEATLESDFPVRMTLLSGYRTPRRNRGIEGAAYNSQHIRGRAADITLTGVPLARVADLAERAGAHGVGRYPRFLHVDVGPKGRRW